MLVKLALAGNLYNDGAADAHDARFCPGARPADAHDACLCSGAGPADAYDAGSCWKLAQWTAKLMLMMLAFVRGLA